MDNPGISRRGFLSGARPRHPSPPWPPGVTAQSILGCTGCDACAQKCPQGIIVIRDTRAALDFARGECTFCGACAEACPEEVFLSGHEMAHAVEISDDCLARAGITCMTCRDACPEMAIRFRPRIGGPFLPELQAESCTGCGACIAPCPSSAIAVVPLPSLPLPEVAHA